MLNTAEFEQIYQGMIAGRIPNHAGDVHLSIFYIARDTLNTDKIHLLVSLSKDQQIAYYLAAPSSSFSSVEEFRTEMAVAFPTHPDHRGNGLYWSANGSRATVLEITDERFRLMTNATTVLQDFANAQDLPVYDVSQAEGWRMESTAKTYARFADTFSLLAIKFSAYALIGCLAVSLVASGVQAQLKASAQYQEDQKASEINGLINKVEFTSPLNVQVGRIQKLGATVVRAGGWIEEYELRKGRESFKIAMPEWVTQDYIEVMGKRVVADRDRSANVVYFTMAKPLVPTPSAVPAASTPSAPTTTAPGARP
jgi:hypothetical protein